MKVRGDKRYRRIARRITLGVVMVVLLVSAIRVSMQVHLDFRRNEATLRHHVQQLGEVELPALRHALWVFDEPQVYQLLDGLVGATDISFAGIRRDNEFTYVAGERPTSDVVVTTLPVTKRHRGDAVALGDLVIVGSATDLVDFIRDKALLQVLVSLIEISLLVALLLIVTRRSVVARIEQLTHHAGAVAAGRRDLVAAQPLPGDRGVRDEIDQLSDTFNLMTRQLLDTQDNLERRVRERTRMLTRTNRDLMQAQQLAGMGSWVCLADGSCPHWSQTLFEMLQYDDRVTPAVDRLLERVATADREPLQQAIRGCLEDRQPFELELHLVLPDGVRLRARVDGAYEDPGAVRGVLQDITLAAQARDDMQLAQVVIDNTAEGVMVTGPDCVIQSVNPGFTWITGYTADEVVGGKPSLLASGRHDEAFFRAMWQTIDSAGHWQGDIWNRRKNGEIYPQWLSISAIADAGKVKHYVGVFSDITAIQESHERLRELAYHDALTGLPNRLMFMNELDNAIKRARRHEQLLAVLFVDLDGFKDVNDVFGHLVGDTVLQQVSERLLAAVRGTDLLARLAGDEFVLLIEDLEDRDQAAAVATKILNALQQPFTSPGEAITISASIGISVLPDDGEDAQTLLNVADAAMYLAKREGKARVRFYGRVPAQR